jgi:cytosine/adenosine deaminase-related metal-dependent hydrolase
MRQSAALARSLGVRLHTHLAETLDEEQFCLEKFGYRPAAYMETLDWVGDDVWYAHSVHVNDSEIALYARTGCGVAHCPSSNMRLASGIAPVTKYRAAGVKVGLGVDGSASNDSSHLLAEARQAMLLARVLGDPGALTARQALELATRGGAAVLGRDDIGALAPGKCADFFAIDLHRLPYAGALHDPVAAVLFCAPQNVDYTVVHGRVLVRAGHLTTVDLGPLVERHNQIASAMVVG